MDREFAVGDTVWHSMDEGMFMRKGSLSVKVV